jgi:GTP-binding protein EngB required for normal cell division
MKLYTEEQLQESYNRGLMDGRLNNIDYSITDGFKPIELPKPMKTAMQELIEFIESTNNTPYVNLTIMDKAKKLLEKEKKQIIEAGNACSIKTIVHREKLDEMSEDELRDSLVEDTISHGEEYYNQTYKTETI